MVERGGIAGSKVSAEAVYLYIKKKSYNFTVRTTSEYDFRYNIIISVKKSSHDINIHLVRQKKN